MEVVAGNKVHEGAYISETGNLFGLYITAESAAMCGVSALGAGSSSHYGIVNMAAIIRTAHSSYSGVS